AGADSVAPKRRWWALAPSHKVGSRSTCCGRRYSTPSATAVTRRVSVNVGRCRLCCSQAAMGATTTTASRGTCRSCGEVISANFMGAPRRQVALDAIARQRHTPRPGGGCQRKTDGEADMAATSRRWARWLPAVLLLGVCGCHREDADHLARVARKAAEQVQTLTGGTQGKLAQAWQALRAHCDEMALDARVAARLRWDKALAG